MTYYCVYYLLVSHLHMVCPLPQLEDPVGDFSAGQFADPAPVAREWVGDVGLPPKSPGGRRVNRSSVVVHENIIQ